MSDGSGRRIVVTGRAERDLRHLMAQDQARVRAAIDGLRSRPLVGDIRKLQGSEEWRLRVGDLRVRFELAEPFARVGAIRVLEAR